MPQPRAALGRRLQYRWDVRPHLRNSRSPRPWRDMVPTAPSAPGALAFAPSLTHAAFMQPFGAPLMRISGSKACAGHLEASTCSVPGSAACIAGSCLHIRLAHLVGQQQAVRPPKSKWFLGLGVSIQPGLVGSLAFPAKGSYLSLPEF